MQNSKTGTPVFKHWFNFSIRRNPLSTFLVIGLIFLVYCFLFAIVESRIMPSEEISQTELLLFTMIMTAVNIPFLLMAMTIFAQRLRDRDTSGWIALGFLASYLFINYLFLSIQFAPETVTDDNPTFFFDILIKLIGVWFLTSASMLVLMMLPGTKGPNRFGDSPLGIQADPKAADTELSSMPQIDK